MANRININGIELTREETFPTITVTESKVEEIVVEVKETKKGKKEVVEDKPIVEETEVTEETTDEVADESKDEE